MFSIFRDMPIRRKFIVFYILFIILPVIAGASFLYCSASDRMLRQEYQNRLSLLGAVSADIDSQLKSLHANVISLYDYTDLFHDAASYQTKRRALIAYFERASRFSALHYVDAVDDTAYVFYRDDLPQALSDIPNEWIEQVKAADGRAVWLCHTAEGMEPQILCAAMIKNILKLHEPVGYVFCLVEPGELNRLFDMLRLSDQYETDVFLPTGQQVWSYRQAWSVSDASASGKSEPDVSAPDRDLSAFSGARGYVLSKDVNGRDIYSVYVRSSQTDWVYVCRSLLSDIQMLNQSFLLYAILLCSVLLISLLLGMRFIYGTIIKPLRLLVLSLNTADPMRLRKIANESHDEIGELYRSYNAQIDRIQQLMHDVDDAHRRELKQELNALQAQINPHFLYNSLDSIAWMARAQGVPEIARQLASLSRTLHYSISPHKRYASFYEELRWVQKYIDLQRLRFPGLFEARYLLDERVYPYGTFRLILQPFVENSIHHGFYGMQSGGVITIRAALKEGFILLVVEDNGSGISAARLQTLEGHMQDGIGIFNVHRRLRLRFGGRFGVAVRSPECGGVRVEMRLPAVTPDALQREENGAQEDAHA